MGYRHIVLGVGSLSLAIWREAAYRMLFRRMSDCDCKRVNMSSSSRRRCEFFLVVLHVERRGSAVLTCGPTCFLLLTGRSHKNIIWRVSFYGSYNPKRVRPLQRPFGTTVFSVTWLDVQRVFLLYPWGSARNMLLNLCFTHKTRIRTPAHTDFVLLSRHSWASSTCRCVLHVSNQDTAVFLH